MEQFLDKIVVYIFIILQLLQLASCSPQHGVRSSNFNHDHGHGQRRHQMSALCQTNLNHPNQYPLQQYHGGANQADYQNNNPPIDFSEQRTPQNDYNSPPQPPIYRKPSAEPVGQSPGQYPGDTNTSQDVKNSNGGGLAIFPPGKGQSQTETDASCPEGTHGIYPKTGLCYKFVGNSFSTGELSPCGQFMDFYKSPTNPSNGDCECKDNFMGIPRPIVYWTNSDQCFWLFDQGPCELEEWLVLNDRNEPICSKRSCPENSPEDWSDNPADNKRKYWFRHRGKCYKSDSKGYCEKPEENIYLLIKDQNYVTECKPLHTETKTLLNGIKQLPCLPGHKQSATGECRKSGTFS